MATDAGRIRLLLVDDHPVVRRGLRSLLEAYADLEVCGEAGTVAESIGAATALRPHVVLLDVRLPDGNGFDACRRMLGAAPGIQVLFLTSFADDETVSECLRAGAAGYLLKEVDEPGLVAAIRAVAAGQSTFAAGVAARVFDRLHHAGSGTAESRLGQLSPQERRVLVLVAGGKTNKEIGLELGLSDKTVKNYLSNVMEKLGTARRSEAAALYARQGGFSRTDEKSS